MSLRKTIRDLVFEIITGKTQVGDNVFVNRVSRSKSDKFPQINIYTTAESVKDADEAPRRYVRTLTFEFEVLSCKTNGREAIDEVDEICEQIEQLLLAEDADKNRELGCMCSGLELVNTDYSIRNEGEGAITAATLMYTVEYTDLGYVGKIDGTTDNNTFGSGWDIHPDEGVEAEDILTFEE